jgi:hypothetical protein
MVFEAVSPAPVPPSPPGCSYIACTVPIAMSSAVLGWGTSVAGCLNIGCWRRTWPPITARPERTMWISSCTCNLLPMHRVYAARGGAGVHEGQACRVGFAPRSRLRSGSTSTPPPVPGHDRRTRMWVSPSSRHRPLMQPDYALIGGGADHSAAI